MTAAAPAALDSVAAAEDMQSVWIEHASASTGTDPPARAVGCQRRPERAAAALPARRAPASRPRRVPRRADARPRFFGPRHRLPGLRREHRRDGRRRPASSRTRPRRGAGSAPTIRAERASSTATRSAARSRSSSPRSWARRLRRRRAARRHRRGHVHVDRRHVRHLQVGLAAGLDTDHRALRFARRGGAHQGAAARRARQRRRAGIGAFGRQLYERATAAKRFLLVEGGTHSSTSWRGAEQYRAALREFFGIGAAGAIR